MELRLGTRGPVQGLRGPTEQWGEETPVGLLEVLKLGQFVDVGLFFLVVVVNIYVGPWFLPTPMAHMV